MEKEFSCDRCSNEDINKINVARVIAKLDTYFKTNDLENALKFIEYWENEASKINDERGELALLNEKIGITRKLNNKELGIKTINRAIKLIKEDNFAIATIYVNIATALAAFNLEASEYFNKAKNIYINNNKEDTYEYASLLNNEATYLTNINKFDEAEININQAINILKQDKKHDGEIAISYINLAHLIYDRNENDIIKVEEAINNSWDYLSSPNIIHDASYAYILSKCAPSFRYFKRELEANVLEDIAKEIYGG